MYFGPLRCPALWQLHTFFTPNSDDKTNKKLIIEMWKNNGIILTLICNYIYKKKINICRTA